jgi:hypothetical protein
MRKLDLSGWAAIAEIVATVAVVFSLLLVAYSIQRNTEEIEISNSNFLYQLELEISGDLSRDPGLASIFIKVAQGDTLSEIEKFQYLYVQHRYLTQWEIAWTQYKRGSLALVDWRDWDRYLSDYLTDAFPEELWIEIRSGYKPEFAEHVDGKYTQN